MIDNLNNAGIQKLQAELSAGRLESLLRIGQTQVARVVEVTAQPARTTTSAQTSTPSSTPATPNTSRTAATQTVSANSATGTTAQTGTSSAAVPLQRPAISAAGNNQTTTQNNRSNRAQSNAQATSSSTASTPRPPTLPPPPSGQQAAGREGQTAPTTPTSSASTANQVYRAKLNVQGRIIEIVTPRPLTAGSEIQISRDANNQISLRVPSATVGERPASAATPQTQVSTQQATKGSESAGQQAAQSTVSTKSAVEGIPLRPGQALTATVIKVVPETASGRSTESSAGAQNTPNPASSQAANRTPLLSAQPTTQQASSSATPTPQTSTYAQVYSTQPTPSQAQASNSSQASRTPPALSGQNTPAQAQTASSQAETPPPRANSVVPQQFRVTLDVQGRSLDVLTPRPLPLGTEVQLRQDNQGQLSVNVPRSQSQAVDGALRQHLPQQQPPVQLLNFLAEPQTMSQLTKGEPLLQGLVQLLLGRSLTVPQKTDASNVQQQLQNSGTLLENRLARGDTQALKTDQKSLLLKLEQQLANTQRAVPQPIGQRIGQMTQEAISRVLVNQLSSLPQQRQEAGTEVTRTLQLDIPILWQGRNENLQLKISTEERPTAEGDAQDYQRRWQVQLRFEMEKMPPMTANLVLEGEEVSIIWFGDKKTRALLEPNLGDLQQKLESIGLEIGTLGVREQAPPKITTQPREKPLIDVKT